MDLTALARIDPYPYQHHLAEVMTAPVTIPRTATLAAVAQAMQARQAGAVVIVDSQERPLGILTERDLVGLLAAHGAGAAALGAAAVMSHPVVTLPPEALLYVALARMQRLGIGNLVVADPLDGRVVGQISTRRLLTLRAQTAATLAEDVLAAPDGAAMLDVQRRLPSLAQALLAESVGARQVAAVISAISCDMSARAAVLAEQAMLAEGWGPAPAGWCFLVLGSSGRGEALLAPDQDNALVHAGVEDDSPWFAELGKRAADLLNAAGIPYCAGGVMAMNRECRHSLDGWRSRLDLWIEDPAPEALLNADIFYDFQPVHGDVALAAALRAHATEVGRSSLLQHLLVKSIREKGTALNIFGGFRQKRGRVDLKKGGLLPIVAGARVMALKLGIAETATSARWAAAAAARLISAEDHARIEDAHEMLLGLILVQQIEDLAAGRAPGSSVELNKLLGLDRDRLKQALKCVGQIDLILGTALAG